MRFSSTVVFSGVVALSGRTKGEVVGIKTDAVTKTNIHSWVSSASTFDFPLSRGQQKTCTERTAVSVQNFTFPHLFVFDIFGQSVKQNKSECFCISNTLDGGVGLRTSTAREFVLG